MAKLMAHETLTIDDAKSLIAKFTKDSSSRARARPAGELFFEELEEMLLSGYFERHEEGRYFVALSLSEAETLRRVLHVRQGEPLLEGSRGLNMTTLSLRINEGQTTANGGGTVLDASFGCSKASSYASASAHATQYNRKIAGT